LTLVCVALVPVLPLTAEMYGGEGPIRMFLFALPFAAALAFLALDRELPSIDGRWPALRRIWQRSAPARIPVALVVMVALFVPSFLGQTELNVVSKGELDATSWFRDHAADGSVLVYVAPGLPERDGGHYAKFRTARAVINENLLENPRVPRKERDVQLTGAADIWRIGQAIHDFSPKGYVIFSDLQRTQAHVLRTMPDNAFDNLENAVADAGAYRLVYRNPHARVYELVDG